jgi:hypothetical protein
MEIYSCNWRAKRPKFHLFHHRICCYTKNGVVTDGQLLQGRRDQCIRFCLCCHLIFISNFFPYSSVSCTLCFLGWLADKFFNTRFKATMISANDGRTFGSLQSDKIKIYNWDHMLICKISWRYNIRLIKRRRT